jgi:hypothetical protein
VPSCGLNFAKLVLSQGQTVGRTLGWSCSKMWVELVANYGQTGA